MAKLGVSIEVTEEGTKQRPEFTNLPNGVYRLQMEACEVIEKNEGTNDHSIMVKSTFEVVEPEEYEKRKIFGNYNLQNKSEIAAKIGNEQFQSLLRALELGSVPDDETDNLLFKTFIATVGMGKDSKDKNADGSPVYPGKNEIKTYWFPDLRNAPPIGVTAAANDNRPAAAASKPASAPPAKAAANDKLPGETPWAYAARKRAEAA